MRISVIVTTYNWKQALELSLRSLFTQRYRPSEIVVADDGSRPDTAATIDRLRAEAEVPLVHVWQEDRGFRAAACRNRAIAAATGEYIVLIDGDVFVHHRFVEDHCRFAAEGTFVQGGRVLLGPNRTGRLLASLAPRSPYFWSRDISNRKNSIRSMLLAHLRSRITADRPQRIRTCNFAFWRRDAIEVNGFNEAFEGWGREDSEFALRLHHAGRRCRTLRHAALAYHLHHEDNSRSALPRNDAILRQSTHGRVVRCEWGLDRHIDSDEPFDRSAA